MADPREIGVSIASPPNRDGMVAELLMHPDDASVAQFAEVFRSDGRLMIGIYGEGADTPLNLPLGAFLEAIGVAINGLEA